MKWKLEDLLKSREMEELKKKILERIDATEIKDIISDEILNELYQIFPPKDALAGITIRTPALAKDIATNPGAAEGDIDIDIDTLGVLHENIDKEDVPIKLLASITFQNGKRYIAEIITTIKLWSNLTEGTLTLIPAVTIEEITLYKRGKVLAITDNRGTCHPNLLWDPYENFGGGLSKTLDEIIKEINKKGRTTIYTMDADLEVLKYEIIGFLDDHILVTDIKEEPVADLSSLDSLILPTAFQNPPKGLTPEILKELLKAAKNSYTEYDKDSIEGLASAIREYGEPIKEDITDYQLVEEFFDTILQGRPFIVLDAGGYEKKLGFDLLNTVAGFGYPVPLE